MNRYKRSLRCPGILGARVQQGLIGSSSSAGMGDCLLLDFSRGFFAVADGSERNPSASREFMRLFSTMLTRIISPSGGRVYGEKEVKTLKRRLIAESDHLLQALSFGDSCTFTGILLLRTKKEAMAGLLFHTGDSLLFSCNVQTGESRQWSKNNFWMVGRTPRFFQVDDLPIVSHTRLLLATDGLANIPFPLSQSREEYIRELFQTSAPEKIPDRLLETNAPLSGGWDDTAIIALDPCSVPISSGCFLFGGTSRIEERIFQEEKKQGLYQNRYLPSVGMEEDRTTPMGL
ncbi:MAG: protein phosphatase 2C family protein [Deltaproteobacteria bacterium]|nr:protein phosphatase 2C family protein [Deltaproteobacteria bacterium]